MIINWILTIFEVLSVSPKPELIDPSATAVSFFPGPTFESVVVYPLAAAESVVNNSQFIHKDTTLFITDYYEPQLFRSHHTVDAYLKANQSNFLILNWGAPLVNKTSELKNPDVKTLVPLVADWILKLWQHIDPKNFNIIAYAKGVEFSRNVARIIIEKTDGQMKLGRLTGLDPPKSMDNDESLSDCADFVDVIHTNTNNFGTTAALGHVDFWPNGGSSQPGCSDDKSSCSRMRSWAYWAESVGNQIGTQFRSYSAASYSEFLETDFTNLGSPVSMGVNCDRSARGNYYLNTNDAYPFAKGDEK